jgi:putative hydrolase of HD superfamily
MLTTIAQEVAHKHFPELDVALVVGFCLVHDLPEIVTGDTGTFNISQEELDYKYKNDQKATKEICEESPPYTAWLLGEYEKQERPEARFVRLLDKLMPPIVDIVGEGSQVMHEDHGVYTLDDLVEAEDELIVRFKIMFPEKELEVLHAAKEYLSQEFRRVFRPRSPILNEYNYVGSLVEG